MKRIIFYIAFLSWISSYFIYLSTYAGIIINSLWIWILHILVLIVLIPIVFNLKEIVKSADSHFNPKAGSLVSFNLFKYLFQATSSWFIAMFAIGIFITIESFITLILNYRGSMQIINGEYIWDEIGKSKTVITEGEYLKQQSFIIRGHVGHWLLFFGIATAILYKYSGLPKRMSSKD